MVNDVEDVNRNIVSADVAPLECQVAGHTFRKGSSTGMLSHKDGYVLKPVADGKGDREANFYEELQSCTDPIVKELKRFVPRFFGLTHFRMNKENLKWIVLENVTRGFAQPCIMDIKIGAQTWDPLATEEKIRSEQKKYRDSKRDVGFCIPGFQVYQLTTGELLKFDREYGKKLNGETVKSSLATFLNADSGLSRTLVLQLLTKLWKILRWFRTQRKYRFYSSSLLLAYDADKLRQSSRSSLANGSLRTSSPTCLRDCLSQSPPSAVAGSPLENWHVVYDNVCRIHSVDNNYDRDLETKRKNYNLLLKDFINCGRVGDQNEIWVNVHMIDFAHVFHSNCDDLDRNYLNGLQNLVNIFEEFLSESGC